MLASIDEVIDIKDLQPNKRTSVSFVSCILSSNNYKRYLQSSHYSFLYKETLISHIINQTASLRKAQQIHSKFQKIVANLNELLGISLLVT